MEGTIKLNTMTSSDYSLRVAVTGVILAVLLMAFRINIAGILGSDAFEGRSATSFVKNKTYTYSYPSAEIKAVEKIILRYSKLSVLERDYLQKEILEVSFKEKIDPSFVASVVAAESSFNTRATSPVGAVGLMQLLPSTADYVAMKNGMTAPSRQELYSPEINIRLGVKYLKELVVRFKSHEVALLAYNWGPTNVTQKLSKAPTSSKLYAKKVLAQAGSIG